MRKLKPLVDIVSKSLVRPKFEKGVFEDHFLTYYIFKSNTDLKLFNIKVTRKSDESVVITEEGVSIDEIRKYVRTCCKPYLMVKL